MNYLFFIPFLFPPVGVGVRLLALPLAFSDLDPEPSRADASWVSLVLHGGSSEGEGERDDEPVDSSSRLPIISVLVSSSTRSSLIKRSKSCIHINTLSHLFTYHCRQ